MMESAVVDRDVPGDAAYECPGQKPVLRVGIFSDTQSRPGRETDRGQIAMRRSMEQLKKKGIDVLLFAGDIANDGMRQVYEEYRVIDREVFGDNPPEEFLIMGNHDYRNGKGLDGARKNFLEGMGLSSVNKSKVVNGYSFIAVSPDGPGCVVDSYSDEACKYLQDEIEAAEARDPDKPIFVMTHHHAKDTVYGSAAWGVQGLTDVLSKYENVVHFSGHSHTPMCDERSIHQDKFTAIGTSTLAYCEMEKGWVNGSCPPMAIDCQEYIYMEVFKDKLVVKRFRCATNQEIKPHLRWVLPLPLKREDFTYTDKRAELSKAPYFPDGAKATVSFPEISEVENAFWVTFNTACHEDCVTTYFIHAFEKLDDGSWRKMWERKYYSDYFRGPENIQNPYSTWVMKEGFVPGRDYKLEIYPMEPFGKIGDKPLSVEFTMPF